MAIRVEWTIEGCGAGSATVQDVDEAVQAVITACRAGTAHLAAGEAAQALLGLVPAARMDMLTNGRQAVERGERWERVRGSLFVVMTPA